MNLESRIYGGAERHLVKLMLSLAMAASVSAQTPSTNGLVPLQIKPGDEARQGTGICLADPSGDFFDAISDVPDQAKEYLRLHRIAATPTNAHWTRALDFLKTKGDAFTVEYLRKKNPTLDAPAQRRVEGALKEIEQRLSKAGSNPTPAELIARLERAALADVTCHSLETSLVPWALASVRPQAKRPEVRSALETASHYTPSINAVGGFGGAFRERVALYARRLLKE